LVISGANAIVVARLAREMPLWIALTEENQSIQNHPPLTGRDVTWFDLHPGESDFAVFRRIVFSLDDHHNEPSQSPAFDTLLVFCRASEPVELGSLTELGFVSVESTSFGYVAIKEESS
jgi:hypothetical protein